MLKKICFLGISAILATSIVFADTSENSVLINEYRSKLETEGLPQEFIEMELKDYTRILNDNDIQFSSKSLNSEELGYLEFGENVRIADHNAEENEKISKEKKKELDKIKDNFKANLKSYVINKSNTGNNATKGDANTVGSVTLS